ncbi:MAG: hypothetical protein COV66_14240 [Nitrospinae bacterium CG11_big_fil_rev_8_21_14_0_20_45_15]|nr:MAG: hypothetical protein COV66_14240 [Nitrospinae bacterium CG11_big_fil_rev_8_21_14_0_20_45_15]
MRKVTFLFFLFFSLWGISNAHAMTHVHTHDFQAIHDNHDGVSPFSKTESPLSLHCILKNHSAEKFCPHKQKPLTAHRDFGLYSSCNSHSPGSLPAKVFSHAKDLIKSEFFIPTVSSTAHKIHSIRSSEKYPVSDLSDPPPRFL